MKSGSNSHQDFGKLPLGFKGAKEKAQEYIKNPEKTEELIEKALEKAEKHKDRLKDLWQDIQSLFRLIKSWRIGVYRKVSWQTILLCVAAVIYFLNPFDLVPDFIFIFGYLDDAAVIAFVMKSVKKELEKFLAWEKGGNA